MVGGQGSSGEVAPSPAEGSAVLLAESTVRGAVSVGIALSSLDNTTAGEADVLVPYMDGTVGSTGGVGNGR